MKNDSTNTKSNNFVEFASKRSYMNYKIGAVFSILIKTAIFLIDQTGVNFRLVVNYTCYWLKQIPGSVLANNFILYYLRGFQHRGGPPLLSPQYIFFLTPRLINFVKHGF